MKKKLKIIVIVLISIIVCYGIYIGVEVYRFNNKTGCLPLIQIGEINVDIAVNSDYENIKYQGLGYTFEYRYIAERKDDLELNKFLSGEMKLFNKLRLIAWIE